MPAQRTGSRATDRSDNRRGRVAIVFEHATLCGGEHSMLAVLDHPHASAWESVVVAPAEGRLADALRERGIRHIPLVLRDRGGNRLPAAAARKNLVTALEQADADVVHANSLSMGRLTGAVAPQLDGVCVAHLRDIIKLSRSAVSDLNGNRLLIAVSQATRDFHVGQGADAARVRVLYNGVDRKRFQPRPSTGRLKQLLNIPQESFLAAAVGQIGLRKGQDVLAAAASLVAEELPQVHFLLIGERHSVKQESIDFERAIVQRFEAAGLRERFHRLRYRKDMPWVMNEVDLLVHPARQEPLGRVLLEAAASGLPILATSVGGTEEILTDGKSARLVAPGDPVAMAVAIKEMCRNPQRRAAYAAEAHREVAGKFCITAAAGKLTSLWTSLATTEPHTA